MPIGWVFRRLRAEVAMRYLIRDGTETPDELRRMIVTLRDKQRCAVIESTRREYGDDIDECLDALILMARIADMEAA